MHRRLYFVLPDVKLANTIIGDLMGCEINAEQMRIASRKPARTPIPDVTVQDANTDWGDRLEHVLWNFNLGVFFVAALSVLVMLATQGPGMGLLVPLGIMLLSFIAGLQFTHVPNTHLREFSAALRHGELVLMVSVPRDRVAEIEARVQRYYPAAAIGGVGWSSDLLHI